VAIACSSGCVAHSDAAAVALSRAQGENPEVVLAAGLSGGGAGAAESQALQRLSTRMFNQLKAVDSRHLSIARQELRGVVTGWDHVTEVRDAAQGLRNTVGSLRAMLGNPNLTDAARAQATGLLRRQVAP
jgi:hypothetical protein